MLTYCVAVRVWAWMREPWAIQMKAIRKIEEDKNCNRNSSNSTFPSVSVNWRNNNFFQRITYLEIIKHKFVAISLSLSLSLSFSLSLSLTHSLSLKNNLSFKEWSSYSMSIEARNRLFNFDFFFCRFLHFEKSVLRGVTKFWAQILPVKQCNENLVTFCSCKNIKLFTHQNLQKHKVTPIWGWAMFGLELEWLKC